MSCFEKQGPQKGVVFWWVLVSHFIMVAGLVRIVYADPGWFGLDTCPNHWNFSTGYCDAMRFQAPEDGTSARLEILTWSSTKGSTLRMGVYADLSGNPGNLLWEGTDITYMGGEWCGEDVSTIELVAETYYWFAFKTSSSQEMCYVPGGPTSSHRWKSGQPYGEPFPDPYGSADGGNENRYTMRMHYTTEKKCKGIIEPDDGITEGGILR